MLSIPAYDTIEGITIFRDDEDPFRFYYLPRNPRLARGEDGKPQFTFLRYMLPIDRKPDEPPGGGYLVFTAVMREEPQLIESRIRPALQARVRAENPNRHDMPQVVVAPVDFTDGEVRLIILQSDRFIEAVTLGKPSLFGDNTASVAVELTDRGATLFYDALKQGGSIAAIEYDLTFPVRLPAITIRGHVDSQEVKSAVIGYTREQITSDDTWGNEETREVAHRTSISETMESQGLIQLEILKGNVDLSDEDLESLRAFAFRAMDEFIKEHFLKGGSVETAADRESQWTSYLAQDITARFDLNVSYRDVINRNYNPSLQVNPSFLGAPLDDLVLDIDLNNAPWYYLNLDVTVDTNLDFDKYGDVVHSVVGHLSYNQRRDDGTPLVRRESVVFRRDDTKPKTFKTSLAGVGKDTYHVEIEVNYKSGPVQQAIIRSFDTTTRNLTLDVPNPGVLEVEFGVPPATFDDRLMSIEADIDYADPRNDVPRATETVVLDTNAPVKVYRRIIYAPWDMPYRYRYTYVIKDADNNVQRSTTEWMEGGAGQRYPKVPTPFDDAFDLSIIPSVDWQEVRQLVVDLEYDDDVNDYHMRKTVSFSKDVTTLQTWKFVLRDPDHRAFRYKQTYLLHNSAIQETDWQNRETDGSLKVGNAPFGVATVEVDPTFIDVGGDVRLALVRLAYTGTGNGETDTETLRFRDSTPQLWFVTLAPNQTEYRYDVEYFMHDNTRRSLTDQRGRLGATKEFLVIPPPPTG